MGVEDIEVLGKTCDYVFGLPDQVGDPSPHTAMGVFMGMRAAVEHAVRELGDRPAGCCPGRWQRGISPV